VQRLKQWPGSLVANFSALIGRPATYVFLDPVQGSDSLKGLARYRRSVRLLQVVKLAPNVGPTRRFLNVSIRVKLIEPRIGFGLQCSSKLAKMTRSMTSIYILVQTLSGGRLL